MERILDAGIGIILTIMSYFDIKEKKLPLWTMAAALLYGCLANFLPCFEKDGMLSHMILGLAPGMLFLFLAWCTKQIGYADGVVLCAMGMLLGMQNCFLALFFGLCISTLFSVGALLLHKVKPATRLPFMPFLEGGYLIWFFLFCI